MARLSSPFLSLGLWFVPCMDHVLTIVNPVSLPTLKVNDCETQMERFSRDGVAWEYRRCATDSHGSVAGLLAEMRARRKSDRLPWVDKAARDAAAAVVREMSWLTARTRSALVRHIGRTPYLEDSEKVVRISFVSTDGAPNFAYYCAARTRPMWSYHLGDLRAETGRQRGRNRFSTQAGRYATSKPNASRRRTCPKRTGQDSSPTSPELPICRLHSPRPRPIEKSEV